MTRGTPWFAPGGALPNLAERLESLEVSTGRWPASDVLAPAGDVRPWRARDAVLRVEPQER
jgi:hypothetical protein